MASCICRSWFSGSGCGLAACIAVCQRVATDISRGARRQLRSERSVVGLRKTIPPLDRSDLFLFCQLQWSDLTPFGHLDGPKALPRHVGSGTVDHGLLPVLPDVLAPPFAGSIFSRCGSRLLLFTVTAAGVFFLSISSTPCAFLSSAIIGFAAGGESDITPYLLSRYFSLQSFSTLYGLAWTAFAAGTAVGPIVMGRLYSSTGGYQPWGIQLFVLPTLLSAVLMTLMPAYPRAGSLEMLPSMIWTTL